MKMLSCALRIAHLNFSCLFLCGGSCVLNNFFQYLPLVTWVTPRSKLCNMLVQFAGKKITLMSGRWAGHLSVKSSTFLFAESILTWHWQRKFTNYACCSELSSGMYCHVKGRQSFYTAVHPRRQFWTSYSPPWELEISHMHAVCTWTLNQDPDPI
jgi:hypothetical protein